MASTWPELHAGTTFGYVWDVSTLAWIKAVPSGGAGGGGLTDTELRASAVPVSISGSIAVTGPLTDTQLRATPVPISGTVAATAAQLPAALGQTTMAASLPVVLASDQSTIAVTGPLTNTQLRATAVPVSATQLPVSLVSSGMRVSVQSLLGSSTIPVQIAAGTVSVSQVYGALNDPADVGIGNTGFGTQRMVLASDQPAVAVTGTFWQATQPVSIAAAVTVTGPLTDTQLRATPVSITGSIAATSAADVFAPDGTAGYTVAQTGKNLTQTYDGRLRTLAAGYVGTEFQDSSPRSPIKSLPLSSDGTALLTRDRKLHGVLEELLIEMKSIHLVLSLGFGISL